MRELRKQGFYLARFFSSSAQGLRQSTELLMFKKKSRNLICPAARQ